MEQNKIDMFIVQHDEHFSAQGKIIVRQKLEAMSESDMMTLNALKFKSPTTTLIFAWLLAGYGVNGFYVKKIGWGVTMIILNIIYIYTTLTTIMNVIYYPYFKSDAIMVCSVMITIVGMVLFVLWIIGIVKARKWTQEYNLNLFMQAESLIASK